MRTTLAALGVFACMLVAASPAHAQFKNGNQTVLLDLPRVSQRAVVTQRVGLTDVTIVYHRPLAGGRKINWYGLARAQVALGDRAAAKKTLEDSAKYAVQPQHKAAVKRLLERLAAGQGIG